MPYHWIRPSADSATGSDASLRIELHIWPHRSLPRQGFVWVIGLTAGALALPMLAVVGTQVLWGLLPFGLLAIWGLWFAIKRSYRSGTTREHLIMTSGVFRVLRHDPGREDRIWQTNPYWLRVDLHSDGPVEHYLTVTDGQRVIELGRFLPPEERVALRDELQRELMRIRQT